MYQGVNTFFGQDICTFIVNVSYTYGAKQAITVVTAGFHLFITLDTADFYFCRFESVRGALVDPHNA